MFRSDEILEGQVPDQMIVLGPQKNNPFTPTIIGQAYQNIYGFTPDNLPTTDLYVRFLPANLEELKTLLDIEDLSLYDFPFDYHVIQEGSYYHDPSIPEEDITWQYSVVKPDFEFPDVQFEILYKLVLVPYWSKVAAEAFKLTGNAHEMIVTTVDDVTFADPIDPCIPSCPNYPACLTDPYVGCESTTNPPTTGGGVGGGNEDPPCDIDNPEWPDCLMVEIEPGTPTFGDPTTTDCGCVVSANPRIPGGCIQLNDTQLGIEGVRNVAIEWWDGWFTVHKTSTDDNGCWRLNHAEAGKAKLTIKYKNDRRVIRSMRGIRIWEYAFAVDSETKYGAPPYNDSNVIFNTDDDDDSHAKKRWYAATANNALYEFDDFAAADGILPPPSRLDLLLINHPGPASAPMLDEMLKNPIINIASSIVSSGAVIMPLATFISTFIPAAGGGAGVFGALPPLLTYVKTFAPDVIYSYGNEIAAFNSSDRVKNIFYHEYAHAAHYAGLDNNFYWLGNVATIASNGGNGDGTDANSERIAISEAWAAMIGDVYADRRYGVEHNLANSDDIEDIENSRYIFRHEEFNPFTSDETWIPEGVFLDCIDNNTVDNPPGISEPVIPIAIVDGIANYTIANCFNAISNEPQTVADVRTDLVAVLPFGQTPASVIALFLSYGY